MCGWSFASPCSLRVGLNGQLFHAVGHEAGAEARVADQGYVRQHEGGGLALAQTADSSSTFDNAKTALDNGQLVQAAKLFGVVAASPNATPEQLKQIQARQAEMQQGLAQQRDQANNYLNNRRAERIKVFSDQIKTIASRLAKAEGYSVVVLPMGLLWNEESVDLTGKVIDEVNKLRAAGQFSSPPASAPAP